MNDLQLWKQYTTFNDVIQFVNASCNLPFIAISKHYEKFVRDTVIHVFSTVVNTTKDKDNFVDKLKETLRVSNQGLETRKNAVVRHMVATFQLYHTVKRLLKECISILMKEYDSLIESADISEGATGTVKVHLWVKEQHFRTTIELLPDDADDTMTTFNFGEQIRKNDTKVSSDDHFMHLEYVVHTFCASQVHVLQQRQQRLRLLQEYRFSSIDLAQLLSSIPNVQVQAMQTCEAIKQDQVLRLMMTPTAKRSVLLFDARQHFSSVLFIQLPHGPHKMIALYFDSLGTYHVELFQKLLHVLQSSADSISNSIYLINVRESPIQTDDYRCAVWTYAFISRCIHELVPMQSLLSYQDVAQLASKTLHKITPLLDSIFFEEMFPHATYLQQQQQRLGASSTLVDNNEKQAMHETRQDVVVSSHHNDTIIMESPNISEPSFSPNEPAVQSPLFEMLDKFFAEE